MKGKDIFKFVGTGYKSKKNDNVLILKINGELYTVVPSSDKDYIYGGITAPYKVCKLIKASKEIEGQQEINADNI